MILNSLHLDSLAYFAQFLKPYRRMCYWSIVALVVASLNLLFLPVTARYMMDFGFIKEVHNSEYYFLMVAMVSTFSALSAAWRYYLVSWVSERVVSDMRKEL